MRSHFAPSRSALSLQQSPATQTSDALLTSELSALPATEELHVLDAVDAAEERARAAPEELHLGPSVPLDLYVSVLGHHVGAQVGRALPGPEEPLGEMLEPCRLLQL